MAGFGPWGDLGWADAPEIVKADASLAAGAADGAGAGEPNVDAVAILSPGAATLVVDGGPAVSAAGSAIAESASFAAAAAIVVDAAASLIGGTPALVFLGGPLAGFSGSPSADDSALTAEGTALIRALASLLPGEPQFVAAAAVHIQAAGSTTSGASEMAGTGGGLLQVAGLLPSNTALIAGISSVATGVSATLQADVGGFDAELITAAVEVAGGMGADPGLMSGTGASIVEATGTWLPGLGLISADSGPIAAGNGSLAAGTAALSELIATSTFVAGADLSAGPGSITGEYLYDIDFNGTLVAIAARLAGEAERARLGTGVRRAFAPPARRHGASERDRDDNVQSECIKRR